MDDVLLALVYTDLREYNVAPHFEICVSKNKKHFFATHDRSITSEEKFAEVYRELNKRFPVEEGWELTISYYFGASTTLPLEAVDRKQDPKILAKALMVTGR